MDVKAMFPCEISSGNSNHNTSRSNRYLEHSSHRKSFRKVGIGSRRQSLKRQRDRRSPFFGRTDGQTGGCDNRLDRTTASDTSSLLPAASYTPRTTEVLSEDGNKQHYSDLTSVMNERLPSLYFSSSLLMNRTDAAQSCCCCCCG